MDMISRRLLGAVVMLLVLQFAGCDVTEIYRPTHERDELAEAEGLCLAQIGVSEGSREDNLMIFSACVVLPEMIRTSYGH